jgi:polyferredoxin
MVMSSRQKKSLIGYFFGLPGEGGRVLRQNVVLVGSVAAIFLVFFFYLLLVRVPLDMTVLPNYAFQPRITDEGAIVNSYVLSLKNRGRLDVELQLAVTGINGILKIATEKGLHIKAGDLKRLPVYVAVRDFKERGVVKDIEIAVKSIRDDKLHVARKANFIVPER